jgi:hypothetical protein
VAQEISKMQVAINEVQSDLKTHMQSEERES